MLSIVDEPERLDLARRIKQHRIRELRNSKFHAEPVGQDIAEPAKALRFDKLIVRAQILTCTGKDELG